jgi:hypothetical protein
MLASEMRVVFDTFFVDGYRLHEQQLFDIEICQLTDEVEPLSARQVSACAP